MDQATIIEAPLWRLVEMTYVITERQREEPTVTAAEADAVVPTLSEASSILSTNEVEYSSYIFRW